MPNQFLNETTVDILKLGLIGLTFLFAVMGFILLSREQKRERPRRIMLNSIKFFTYANILASCLVCIIQIMALTNSPLPEENVSSDYLVDETRYVLSFSEWVPLTSEEENKQESPVKSDRIDSFKKATQKDSNFIIPQYTTGKEIRFKEITNNSGESASFKKLPGLPDESNRKGFQYELHIGSKPQGTQTRIHNEFTFINGFRPTPTEWFAASVKYPTDYIEVEIQFPENKPCTSVKVYLKEGIAEKKLLTQNPPKLLNDGLLLKWSGYEFPSNSRIYFEYSW